mmetsp:Transcript_28868/g.26197  ORF Transcript_28868/g.26197 Transcript_28868/m.26197 type:complete len:133 (-) Transcript_28868:565-963(-)|eukprot:CAMPEP_0114580512 /NCGR_PEP_ID=MMETSP0125-20121206/4781_1 /TAXON_ID=485358 ORGANISM="Aristerostoma sp., Strain ATCC 50986" /NCGR_SAMPLE_ID=MMETSP0125 /ASSEMBLY_ACC=CAM_ASM_000245 /LENGTH=132 /DNA_ID=CAMNT_0001772115 /DNA_START=806 /DNA_END=1204 /DNA_ORIENTATION=-
MKLFHPSDKELKELTYETLLRTAWWYEKNDLAEIDDFGVALLFCLDAITRNGDDFYHENKDIFQCMPPYEAKGWWNKSISLDRICAVADTSLLDESIEVMERLIDLENKAKGTKKYSIDFYFYAHITIAMIY